ncbi:RNA 2',3'-cyclic phosphodiesterase [Natrarchaeobaculum sulfurireducens]|uniref:RNA 2',3'-cyclic phosphodiesterase n=1 Tax=Natrarchaeobaculum sulfurireducens TaxID=2044521 RepID=A0A346PJP9_9EURY|nr:RNA 2',3'-cyclic phosphodiesterase [Natrarchaeobaculum sulfurireducens]AXR79744.1 2'-5' RNA ligase [Natrarchaeobaculum sulfurireducens]AXR83483.1 2'-5' RNA ligase [Natrarchaeobaculum sulfurireducens]
MRLFVSVDLPDDLAVPIADLQDEFAGTGGLNFTDPEQAHLTLKFLGEVAAERVPALEDELAAAVDDANIDPFTVRYGGLGVFPSLEYISVVWLGVEEGSDELTRLHEAIETRATAMGFEAEDHEFTPHVTLARMEHAGGKEHVQELVTERDPTIGEATVDAIRLTESTLTDAGPIYSTVESVSLE